MALGRKTGGRVAGVSKNKATKAREAEISLSGLTPLQYMLEVMRDKSQEPSMRLSAAKSAAPYVHPSLSSVDMALTGQVQLGGVRPDDVEGQA
jgi:hypothetical protein